jgi:peptidoglycan-associated lipoprotein
MKSFKISWLALLILIIGLSAGCGKKVIRSEAIPSPALETSKPPETSPEVKIEMKPEASLKEEIVMDAEKDRKLREESLREQELRDKALREENARREAAAREAAALKDLKLQTIYYEFNQWAIQDDQKEILTKNAQWLKANPKVAIRIEGNCDERGTAEYNLSLGQKRAEAAKAFLEGLGISAKQMQTISYGLERPAVRGRSEEAWAKNRRVDFVPAR